jgi:cation diffusion facilitator CzcD-associated flavoprotein CzcO
MKVAVVGTGPAGLTTIKQLLDEGHEVTCFEKQKDLGGLWFRSGDDGDQTKAYDDLRLTISIRLMAFSDFIPEGEREFYTREQYLSYLQAYADRFRLRDHIVFDSAVEKITRLPDGRWRVAVRTAGKPHAHEFDAVALCSGPFQKPNLNLPDLDKFRGEVVHSSRYRNAAPYAGKRVLVVGLAESGADLLRQISDVSSECTLAIRSYSKLVPRIHPGNVATDATVYRAGHYEKWVRATPLAYPMKALFGDDPVERLVFRAAATVLGVGASAGKAVSRLAGRLLGSANRGARPASGLNPLGEPVDPPKMDLGTEATQEAMDAIAEWNRRSHEALGGSYTPKTIYCKNVSFIPNVLNGKLEVKHAEVAGIDGHTVRFSDGTTREVDAIVLATGFHKDFSILENVTIADSNVRHLYKHAFHPDCDGTLAVIGFARPFTGGIPICAEMQARYFALLCSGKLRLPADVRQRIAREKEWEEAMTILSARHTEAIPSQPLFTDAIAKEIGCLPTTWDLLRDPVLFVKMWFASFDQASYRLVGPHSDPAEARRRIMEDWIVQPELILNHALLSWLPHFVHPKSRSTSRRVKQRFPKGAAIATHFLRPFADRPAADWTATATVIEARGGAPSPEAPAPAVAVAG